MSKIIKEIENYEKYLKDAYNFLEESGATLPEEKNMSRLVESIKTIPGSGSTPTNIYEEISHAADIGEAQERFPVGTMIDIYTGEIVTTEVATHLTMRIVGYNGIILEGEERKYARPQLLAVRLLDEPRTFNPDSTPAQCEWRDCALRAWMNQDYLNTLPEDFHNAIKISVVATYQENGSSVYTTEDKLYLPSATEVGGVGDGNSYIEGNWFPYFGTYFGVNSANNNLTALNDLRKATASDGTAHVWWLRSKRIGYYHVWVVNTNGSLNSYIIPTETHHIRPCCNL